MKARGTETLIVNDKTDGDHLGIPPCPVCGHRMEVVYDRYHQIVAVCVECHSGLTIPAAAWELKKRRLREKK